MGDSLNTSADPYQAFLEGKIRMAEAYGFDIPLDEINPALLGHQKAITQWAVTGGRRAIFARFGLGKTVMELETVRITRAHSGAERGLIVCPLGVRQEFKRDAQQVLGWTDLPRFIRRDSEIDGPGVYLTNYEAVREGNVTPANFGVASLDEAAVLRSYGSQTYQEFMPLFSAVPHRFVATAIPDPNRFKELIHYAGFLGIMDTGQALTRFFKRDSTQANNLTLYPHKEKEFWMWVHSWAVFLQRPSDIGFSDEGYNLPELRVHYHEVKVDLTCPDADRDGQYRLFRGAALGLKEAAREKRDSMPARVEKMAEILQAEPDRHAILWHDLEAERHSIAEAVPTAVEVYGSLDIDIREQHVIDFSDGKIQYLATKPELSGSGCNFQRHCSMAVFVGIGYQFHDFIQAIHRIYRFLQTEVCDIHIIYAETEREVLASLQAKWARHEEQIERMSDIIREHGLSTLKMTQMLTRSIGVERIEASGQGWTVANNDCVRETAAMEANSVDLVITSIPFANHYEYTPSYNDFGHTDSNSHFWRQMDYLTPELLRILKPGRLACIHVKDRINFGNVTGKGVPTSSPFHAETIAHYAGMPEFGIAGHGFDYLGMITVVTDVVRENAQTYRLGWSEQCKDATKMGVGSPEYVLIFHKPQTDRSRGYADEPVTKAKLEYTRARWQVDAHAFWRSSGNRVATVEELSKLGPAALAKLFTEYTLQDVYDYEAHVLIGERLELRGALPKKFMCLAPGSHDPAVWHDINRMLTLNSTQTKRGLENHVCPLQFDIVDRLIRRYSNVGELVFDPFGGLFTVPVRALKLDRRGRAVELNTGYFLDGVTHLQAMERKKSMPDLFAMLEAESATTETLEA